MESITDKIKDMSWYWQRRYYETSQNLQDTIIRITALEQQLKSECEIENRKSLVSLCQEHLYTDKCILVKAIVQKLTKMSSSECEFIDKYIFKKYFYDDIISTDLVLIEEVSQAILNCSLKIISETSQKWVEVVELVYKQSIDWYFWIFSKYYKHRLTSSCRDKLKLTGRQIKQTIITYLTNLAIPTIITRYRKF